MEPYRFHCGYQNGNNDYNPEYACIKICESLEENEDNLLLFLNTILDGTNKIEDDLKEKLKNYLGIIGYELEEELKDGYYDLLRKENYSKGIIASDGETGLILDLYIILGYGIKINEILVEVQKKVKYVVESTLDVKVEAVNVYVQGLRNID